MRTFLIGGQRLRGIPWVVPQLTTEHDVYERLLAVPDPQDLSVERCGGIPPTETRGAIWWWVSCH